MTVNYVYLHGQAVHSAWDHPFHDPPVRPPAEEKLPSRDPLLPAFSGEQLAGWLQSLRVREAVEQMHKWPAKRPAEQPRRGGRPRGSGTFRNAKQVALALYPYWYRLRQERLADGEDDPQVSIPDVHDALEPKEVGPSGPVPPVALSTVRYWLQENDLAWPPTWRPEWGAEPDWNAAVNAPKPIPRRPIRRRRKSP